MAYVSVTVLMACTCLLATQLAYQSQAAAAGLHPVPGRALRSATTESRFGSFPGGSIPPRRGGGVVRKTPRGTTSITLQDLVPAPLEPVIMVFPDSTPSGPETTVERLIGEEEDLYHPLPRSSLAGSSLPSSKNRLVKKITECRRRRKTRVLSMHGCQSVTVDVGYCQGACRSREVPGNSLTLSDDAFMFRMQGKCRTCRAEFETRMIDMTCNTALPSPSNNIPADHGQQHTASVAIKVIKGCSCMKCYVD
eukprot:scpid66253/ scgid6257/ 